MVSRSRGAQGWQEKEVKLNSNKGRTTKSSSVLFADHLQQTEEVFSPALCISYKVI
jgi:hypothetical protein